MTVIRVHKNKDFSVISNIHLKDKDMSLKAKGLQSVMLSLPEDWDYSIVGLASLSKDGKDSVMSALNELESLGYLKRNRVIDEKGRFAGYDYDIYETPQTAEPYTENPNTDKPHTENPTQLNTNKSITNKLNINNKENTIKEIFGYWNSNNIVVHRELTIDTRKSIEKALKIYSVEEIKTYIDRYNMVIKDKEYFFSTIWTLKDFLSRKNGISDFTDEGSKWLNYLAEKNRKTTRKPTTEYDVYDEF